MIRKIYTIIFFSIVVFVIGGKLYVDHSMTAIKQSLISLIPPTHDKNIRIAVMDIKRIASTSIAGKQIDEQLTRINDESKKNLLELENLIKKEESSKDRLKDKSRIEDMQMALYDSVREKRYQIAAASEDAISHLKIKISESVKAVAEQMQLDIVLDSDAVHHHSGTCIDITDNIIAHLNSVCPFIEVCLKRVN